MAGLKNTLKIFFSSHPRLAMLASKVRAIALAAHATPYRLVKFRHAYVPLSAKLIGVKSIKIGINSAIGAGSWLNVNHPDPNRPSIVIGNHCFVGQANYFGSGHSIVVQDYFLSGRGCEFVGASHIYDDPTQHYGSTGMTGRNRIYIGANVHLGIAVRVIGNVTIGHGSVIGAGAEVRHDIPPFSLAVGIPARVIKRYDFSKREWVHWPANDYIEGPTEGDYLPILQKTTGAPILHLSAATGLLSDAG